MGTAKYIFRNFCFASAVVFPFFIRFSTALVEITLYSDFNKRGEDIFLSINNCTNLPNDWQDRTSSLNIHNSVCIKVFEHSGCKGRYITLRAAHHAGSEYLENLRDLGFNDVISSVSPCSLQIEDGRYVLQNLGDNKMMTIADEGIYARVYSKYWKNLDTQQFEVTQVPGSDILYEIIPVNHPNHIEKPVVYDIRDFKDLAEYKKVKPTFLIESVDDWKYAIKEARTKLCLATGPKDEIKPLTCHYNAKNQQWIFRIVSS
ncbi:hypothetical protein Ocin01_12930 [Orchesella cincta]|uniref:Uncharacterized protein n=1 Tax=Orchesella cincta TaxID=48709 RepID=A0A1D2ML40_ORCCI|nr:hypothetical protein Ocin01_12930 [Orchesella cincta]